MNKAVLYFLGLGLALAGCEPKVDDPGFGRGSLNPAKYVAVGDSYTANTTNGGLYQEGQELSYPAIIASQLARVGAPAVFQQPLLPGAGTGHLQFREIGPGGFALADKVAPTAYTAADFYGTANCPFTDSLYYLPKADLGAEQLNNLAIPLLRPQDLQVQNLGNRSTPPASSALNPYLERLLPANDTSSYVTVARRSAPTFYTVWLGLDELVSYASSGGRRGTCDIPSTSEITANFPRQLESLLNALEANGARGVVADVPRILEFPFFKQLSVAGAKELARQVSGRDSVQLFITRGNGNVREISDKDILLPGVRALLGQPDANGTRYGLSADRPIEGHLVLDNLDEVNRINSAISEYNNQLRRVLRRRLSLTTGEPTAQINNLLTTIQTGGSVVGGVSYSLSDLRGGLFSLDGLHFSARGNAIIANTFIEKANELFQANIPRVDPNAYPSPLQ